MKQKQVETTKKTYLKPDMKIILIEPVELLAESGEAPDYGEGDGLNW